MLVHLAKDHTAEIVRDGLISTGRSLPRNLRNTLTWDQSAEMSDLPAFAIVTDMRGYLCDPATPWHRGEQSLTTSVISKKADFTLCGVVTKVQ